MTLIFDEKRGLSAEEKIEIALRMQYAAIEAIFSLGNWQLEDAVFHGGTSIRVAWNSVRFSEDLDFMVADRAAEALSKLMRKARINVEERIQNEVPRSTVELKGFQSDGRLRRCEFRWSHPMRQGKVVTKVEFYLVPAETLADYAKLSLNPSPEQRTRVAIDTPISVPRLESVLADKVVAIALRPYHKHRDIFDITFIYDQISGSQTNVRDVIALDSVAHVASIYDHSLNDVLEGLQKAINGDFFKDEAAFIKDMARWLPHDAHQSNIARGAYKTMLDHASDISTQFVTAIQLRDQVRP